MIKEKHGYNENEYGYYEYENDYYNIDSIINAILEFDDFNHVTRKKNKKMKCEGKKGANELFLFSILTGRFEIAKLFWKKGSVS